MKRLIFYDDIIDIFVPTLIAVIPVVEMQYRVSAMT